MNHDNFDQKMKKVYQGYEEVSDLVLKIAKILDNNEEKIPEESQKDFDRFLEKATNDLIQEREELDKMNEEMKSWIEYIDILTKKYRRQLPPS